MKNDRTKAWMNRNRPISWHKKQLKKYVDKFQTVPASGKGGIARHKAWCALLDEGFFEGKKYEESGMKFKG